MSCIWRVSPIHGGCFPREMVTTMEGFAQKSGSLKGKKRRGKGFFRIPMACSVHGKSWWKLLKFKSKTLWKETNRNSYPLPFWIRNSVQQNFDIESLVHNIVRTMNPKLVLQWWWSWHAFFWFWLTWHVPIFFTLKGIHMTIVESHITGWACFWFQTSFWRHCHSPVIFVAALCAEARC